MVTSALPLVYVSYAWGDTTPDGRERELIVDELCAALEEQEQIIVGRDKKLLKTGDSIQDFAADISRGGLVLAVISRKSLRSHWCMVDELLQAFRRRNFNANEFGSDVLALILDDARDDLEDLADLIGHWSEAIERQRKPLEVADPDRKFSPDSWKRVDQMLELRGRFSDLIRSLRIRAMPRGYAAISREDFGEIRELVVNRLSEKGLAAKMSPSNMAEEEQAVHESPASVALHYLAVVLRRQHQRSGDYSEPMYGWEVYLNKPPDQHYEPLSLQEELGSYLTASADKSDLSASAAGLAAPRTIADLIQAVVDWSLRQKHQVLIEVFAPLELLDFDWAHLKVVNPRKASLGPVDLVKTCPYVLRSLARFEDEEFASAFEWLGQKYAQLEKGSGRWIAGTDAVSLDKLAEAEMKKNLVAIKRIDPLDVDRFSRLQWLESMISTMVPVALWRRHGCSNSTKRRLLAHLDGYEGMLAGHANGDFVPAGCARLERLPICRRTMIADPVVHDFVFLLDHPQRAPGLDASQSPLVSP